jgi:hypothetical protein
MDQSGWYAVRCVFDVGETEATSLTYEERVTVWQVADDAEAIALAETEALEYATNLGVAYLGLAQLYVLADDPGHGAEVFSPMRDSDAAPDEYLSIHFATGRERARTFD